MDEPDATTFKAPYFSFQTFWSFIEELASKPLPPQIDRSMLGSKSGTDQANLLNALKSFGLITEAQGVTSLLERFVDLDDHERRRVLGLMLKAHYPNQLSVSASHGTEKQLLESFSEDFGLAGDTRRKAVTFFLHAARHAGLELSAHFPTTRATGSGPAVPRGKRTPRKKPAATTVSTGPAAATAAPMAGDTHSVELVSGGRVSVTVSVNLFALNKEDRKFVMDLVDKLQGYGSPAYSEDVGQAKEPED